MQVIIKKTTAEAVAATAECIAQQVKSRPDGVLGLATGRTMEAVYKVLSERCAAGELDFSRMSSFNLDEYDGLPGTDKNSYRYYMDDNLFNHINIDKSNTYLLNGKASDAEAEGKRYEQLILEKGGIDLQLLGIGENGHIAFNEPLSSFDCRTRKVALTPRTIEQNSPLFDKPEDMPRYAYTMGIGTIMDARRIVLLATGAAKAPVVAATIEGEVTTAMPASVLRNHKDAVIILDEAAASMLKNR